MQGRLAANVKAIAEKEVLSEEQKQAKIKSLTERSEAQITQLKEREALKREQVAERIAQRTMQAEVKAAERSAAAQERLKERQYQSLLRQVESGRFGASDGVVGSKGGPPGSSSVESTTGIFSGSIGQFIGRIAIYKAFEMLTEAAEAPAKAVMSLASDFLSAAQQIGGAKGLAESLVQEARNEKTLQAARMTVAPDERLSQRELQAAAFKLSTRSNLGSFKAEDWLSAFNRIGTISGQQRSIVGDEQTLSFIAKMAHIGNMGVDQMGGLYAQLVKQNPNLKNADIQDILLSGKAIGQKGSFNVSELPEAHKLIEQVAALGGDRKQNIKNVLSYGSILKPTAGSLEEAGTQTQRFIGQLFRVKQQGQDAGLDLRYDKAGRLTNLNDAIANVLSKSTFSLPKALLERESGAFIRNMSAAAGIQDSDSESQRKAKVHALLDEYEHLTTSAAQLNQENEESTTTQDRLSATFNNLTNQLGSQFLPVIEGSIPDIKAFVDAFIDEIPDIRAALSDFFEALVAVIPSAVALGQVGITLTRVMSYLALGVLEVHKALGAMSGWIDQKLGLASKSEANQYNKVISEQIAGVVQFIDGLNTSEKTLDHFQNTVQDLIASHAHRKEQAEELQRPEVRAKLTEAYVAEHPEAKGRELGPHELREALTSQARRDALARYPSMAGTDFTPSDDDVSQTLRGLQGQAASPAARRVAMLNPEKPWGAEYGIGDEGSAQGQAAANALPAKPSAMSDAADAHTKAADKLSGAADKLHQAAEKLAEVPPPATSGDGRTGIPN